MSQHDFSIQTTSPPALSGPALVVEINAALQALASASAGPTEPSTPYAYQYWLDTANNLLKQRDGANNAWVTVASLAGTDFVPYHKGSAIPDIGAKGGALLSTATAIAAFDQLGAIGADIASGSTINLDTATGDIVTVTGTTGITAITLAAGRQRAVRFAGSLPLTHGANLELPGSANIQTAAGDIFVFRGYSGGVVRCVGYRLASGRALVGPTLAQLPAGTVVDVKTALVTANTLLTDTIPADNSKPQSNEGTQVASFTHALKASGNLLLFLGLTNGAVAGSAEIILTALFKDSGADAIAATPGHDARSPGPGIGQGVFIATHSPGDTSSHDYKFRVGASASNLRLNSISMSDSFGGGVCISAYALIEFAQ